MTVRVNPPGTRGARVPIPLVKLIGKLQIRTYRRSGEQRASKRAGFPVVLLTTLGAKTGRTRTAPLGGFPDGENSWLVAATLGGAARHPAWFLNMAKHPDHIWLEVGTERFEVRGKSLEGPERVEALARTGRRSAGFAWVPGFRSGRDSRLRSRPPRLSLQSASPARTGAGISAAPTRMSANAAMRTAITKPSLPSRSPKTASPARIVDRFAATEVTAITATPSPIWRLRAEAKNENIAAVTMTTLQGLSRPTGPLS